MSEFGVEALVRVLYSSERAINRTTTNAVTSLTARNNLKTVITESLAYPK